MKTKNLNGLETLRLDFLKNFATLFICTLIVFVAFDSTKQIIMLISKPFSLELNLGPEEPRLHFGAENKQKKIVK